MQIINLREPASRDIVPPILKLASSEDRLEAFKGQKLIELVRYLQAKGPEPMICGNLLVHELLLSPDRPNSGVTIRVWIDWPDYGPLTDGYPVAHYRLKIERRHVTLSEDARADSPEEIERIILATFDDSR